MRYLDNLILWLLAWLNRAQFVLVDNQFLVVVHQHGENVGFCIVWYIVNVITAHTIQVRLVGTYVGAVGSYFVISAKVIANILKPRTNKVKAK